MVKEKWNLLVGLMLGIVIGCGLEYLRLPYLEKDKAFWLGGVTTLALGSTLLILSTTLNRRGFLQINKTETGNLNPTLKGGMLAVTCLLSFILIGTMFYRYNAAFEKRIQRQSNQIQKISSWTEVVKKTDLIPLLSIILTDIGEELKRSPDRTLRDTTIARIADFSLVCPLHRYIEADSLSEKAYSLERGQLLQALALMNIDAKCFSRIKANVTFVGADLRGAYLRGLDLSGINLQGANLKGADLSHSNLKGSLLSGANFWGADLNKANLDHADLKRADFQWAQLNEAVLSLANLNGANLANAQLRKADLYDALFQWGQSTGALFNEANLSSINFVGTDLTKSNMSQVNLGETDLRKINLSGANIAGANLNKALIEQNWLEKLKGWQPVGMQEILESYSVVNDTFDSWGRPLFRLRNKEYKN